MTLCVVFYVNCIQVKLGWKHNAKIKAFTQNWRSIHICMTPKKHTFTAAIRCCILFVTHFISLSQRTNKQPTGKYIQRKTHSCENWVYLALSMYILFLLYLDYSWCTEPTMIYTYHIHIESRTMVKWQKMMIMTGIMTQKKTYWNLQSEANIVNLSCVHDDDFPALQMFFDEMPDSKWPNRKLILCTEMMRSLSFAEKNIASKTTSNTLAWVELQHGILVADILLLL